MFLDSRALSHVSAEHKAQFTALGLKTANERALYVMRVLLEGEIVGIQGVPKQMESRFIYRVAAPHSAREIHVAVQLDWKDDYPANVWGLKGAHVHEALTRNEISKWRALGW